MDVEPSPTHVVVEGPPAPPPADAEMAERLRRLEDQLSALRAQQAAQSHSTALATTTAVSGVAGLVLPIFQRFGGTGPGPADPTRLGFWTEFRLMARMYVDPHYRVSRVAQFGVPAVLIAMVLNNLFWPSIPVLREILVQTVLVVLAVTLYKILAREASRYAEVLAYLNRHGRGPR